MTLVLTKLKTGVMNLHSSVEALGQFFAPPGCCENKVPCSCMTQFPFAGCQ